jgi:hypothetical protein
VRKWWKTKEFAYVLLSIWVGAFLSYLNPAVGIPITLVGIALSTFWLLHVLKTERDSAVNVSGTLPSGKAQTDLIELSKKLWGLVYDLGTGELTDSRISDCVELASKIGDVNLLGDIRQLTLDIGTDHRVIQAAPHHQDAIIPKLTFQSQLNLEIDRLMKKYQKKP